MCKAAVNRGGYVAYVDAEHAIDPRWAKRFGLDFDGSQHFFLVQPESAEDALNAILKMVKLPHPEDKSRGLFDVIVLGQRSLAGHEGAACGRGRRSRCGRGCAGHDAVLG